LLVSCAGRILGTRTTKKIAARARLGLRIASSKTTQIEGVLKRAVRRPKNPSIDEKIGLPRKLSFENGLAGKTLNLIGGTG
jgi:hypothetical protein